jgi:hypothetical protein
MPTCPAGHESAADDYCVACGRPIGVTPESASPGEGPADTRPADTRPADTRPADTRPADTRPTSGSPTGGMSAAARPTGSGHADTGPASTGPASTGPAAAGPAWSAVVTADRDYFERVVAAGGPEAAAITFPAHCPERRVSLGTSRAGEQRQIGRHSVSRGTDPAIDLTGPPTDPGVSRLHAVLIGRADGGWALLDPGSENGTLVNDQEISTGVQVPLHDGDRIHLGAWTAITIRRG